MSFTSLGLDTALLSALTTKGYISPTPIQVQAIPEIRAGRDLMARAQTGTGKTAAFALPILNTLMNRADTHDHAIKALVLVPTRELAQQVGNSFISYAQNTELKTVTIYGGSSLNTQLTQLENGADVVVATPGRLIDHINRKSVNLDQLSFLVLDEADRMLDMGFIDDIQHILRLTPHNRQTLLFSATFTDAVFKFSQSIVNDAALIEVDDPNSVAVEVEQIAYEVDADKKANIAAYLIGHNNWHQVLVFTRTKKAADFLTKELIKDGLDASAIHGDKSQSARDKALEAFKTGETRVLVATDVASRGLDIKGLKHVINFELPYNPEDYVHRIGRTGRAGQSGQSITLLSADESYLLDDIHTLIGERLLQQWLPGFEPDLSKDFSNKKKKDSPSRKRRRR